MYVLGTLRSDANEKYCSTIASVKKVDIKEVNSSESENSVNETYSVLNNEGRLIKLLKRAKLFDSEKWNWIYELDFDWWGDNTRLEIKGSKVILYSNRLRSWQKTLNLDLGAKEVFKEIEKINSWKVVSSSVDTSSNNNSSNSSGNSLLDQFMNSGNNDDN